MARLALLGVLVLVALIPIAAVDDLVNERTATRHEAFREVESKWGGAQSIAGPYLLVPYFLDERQVRKDGTVHLVRRQYTARFLPEELGIEGTVKTQVRHRGIYEVPLYRGDFVLEGTFAAPDFSGWDIPAEHFDLQSAQLVLEVSHPAALDGQVALEWDKTMVGFEPGRGELASDGAGVHAALPQDGGAHRFRIALPARGSEQLRFAPAGRNTTVLLRADWPHPSFQGTWLPADHDIEADGFQARWQVPHLGRNYAQRHRNDRGEAPSLLSSDFGVDLKSPVDAYRMANRSVKYAGLFVLLTFALVWVFEVVGGFRVHAVQYLLTGAAMGVFYLLQLSLAEHLGFAVAHAAASAAVAAMIGGYSAVSLRSPTRALVVGLVLSGLYTYLYVLLTLQDYALVIGALALFVALGAVMFVTRRVAW